MRLAALLDPQLVVTDMRAKTKFEAIEEILDRVIQHHPHLDRHALTRAINEREDLENTSYGHGIAFPHARTDAVSRMYVALGVTRRGIDSATPDHMRLHAVCLLLTPRNIAQLYLQTLSAFAAFAREPGNIENLVAQPDAEAIIRVIWESGLTVKKQLTVRDIMHRNVFYTMPESTLKDAANIFYRHKVSGVPVVDNDKILIGIISEKHLIKAALPDYETLIENMSFNPEVEPFDELLKREDEIKVSEIMTRKVFTTTEDTPIVEVAAMMMFRNIRRVPVVDDRGRLIGMVLRSDIVSKVIRG